MSDARGMGAVRRAVRETKTQENVVYAIGADEARELRDTSRRLAEIDNLRQTGSLREVLTDLSYTLANLAGPIGALIDQWVAGHDGVDVPDTDVLTEFAAHVRRLAANT